MDPIDPNLISQARKLSDALSQAAGTEDPNGRRLAHKAWQHAKAVIECLTWTPPAEEPAAAREQPPPDGDYTAQIPPPRDESDEKSPDPDPKQD